MPSFNNLNTPLNVVFMGTPEIASEPLQNILELFKTNILDLKCIYTKSPVWDGKTKETIKSSVNITADEAGIKVRTPETLKNNRDEIEFLKSLGLDLIVVVAFGLILPGDILAIPKYGVLNLHPSLLPDLRGPSPVHYAILKRVKYSGVSIMALDSGIDTGPVIAQNKISIGKDEYYETLYKNLSKAGGVLLAEVIKTIFRVKLNVFKYAYPQSSIKISNITESKLINLTTQRLDFFRGRPLEIYSKIRAFRESGGAFFMFKGKIVKLLEAKILINGKEFENNTNMEDKGKCADKDGDINTKDDLDIYGGHSGYYDYIDYIEKEKNGFEEIAGHIQNSFELIPAAVPGMVILANKYGFVIKTAKKGVYLSLLRLKPEGKRLMEYKDFINGYRIKSGDILK
ncbi:MAG: methionyl-tRNA formyltransferase [Deltaproteobacteria bacterium]|nr:methionyl-tRNA formyltransferase [Deltaproteobacteria bacterium]